MAPVLVYSPYNSPRDWLVLLGSKKRATQKADAWIMGAFYKHRLTQVFGEL